VVEMSEEQKKVTGRPTKYTDEIADRICELIATHHCSLKRLTEMFPELPDPSNIRKWRYRFEGFRAKYELAQQSHANMLFEGAVEELEEINNCRFINQNTGALDVSPNIIAEQKALAHQKLKHAAILNKRYRAKDDEEQAPLDTLVKIREMVAEFNKTNASDV